MWRAADLVAHSLLNVFRRIGDFGKDGLIPSDLCGVLEIHDFLNIVLPGIPGGVFPVIETGRTQ